MSDPDGLMCVDVAVGVERMDSYAVVGNLGCWRLLMVELVMGSILRKRNHMREVHVGCTT